MERRHLLASLETWTANRWNDPMFCDGRRVCEVLRVCDSLVSDVQLVTDRRGVAGRQDDGRRWALAGRSQGDQKED